ncbi:MAG: helix-turn-helix domain-containing protein [Planctomycetota bacterium]|nr:helix-turn-helix domain-containing protein [Planctomycetota bacterium]
MAQAPYEDSTTAVSRDPRGFPAWPELPDDPQGHLAEWLEIARVRPVSAVEWQCSHRWALGPRVLNDSMWFWVESGSGWGQVGGRAKFRIEPGSLMLIPQGEVHQIRQDPGSAMHLITSHFHAHVYEGLNLLALAGFPDLAPAQPGAPFEDAARRQAREFALKPAGWRAAMRCEVLRVLLYLVREHGRRFKPAGAAGRHADLPRLLPALRHLDAHLADPRLRVEDLAGKLFLSEVQFRKLFKRVTGLSPVRFIQRRRVERAGQMLRESDLSIEQVASSCGFSDAPFFLPRVSKLDAEFAGPVSPRRERLALQRYMNRRARGERREAFLRVQTMTDRKPRGVLKVATLYP